jgi:hypothetical protein
LWFEVSYLEGDCFMVSSSSEGVDFLRREVRRLRIFAEYVDRLSIYIVGGGGSAYDCLCEFIEASAGICTQHGEPESEAEETAKYLEKYIIWLIDNSFTGNKKIDPKKAYICSRCNDTHEVDWVESGVRVMCTSCPVPCQDCRKGGNGAYCESTPCDCGCHKKG